MSIFAAFKHDFINLKLNIEVEFPSKGLTAIVGPSGAGKSTFLKFLAGLYKFSPAKLVVNGTTWQDKDIFLPTYKRPLGYVFQEALLFPHLTVAGNLKYAKKRAVPSLYPIDHQKVLDIFNIGHLLSRTIYNLSGGESQRVAIVRALFRNPELLILDEPLASLDSQLKSEIIPYIKSLKNFNLAIIYVTHDKTELQQLADYCLHIENGQIITDNNLK